MMSSKKYKFSEERRRKISNALKGKKRPKVVREKISKAHRGKKLSKETKKRISIAGKGRKHSEETKRKIKRNHKGMKGKRHSEETRRKLSETFKREKSSFWQGGKSFEIYPQEWTEDLKDSIRKRDKYICQECGIHQDELYRKIDIHHIDYDKKNCNPNNLITLCRSCHIKTNHNRIYWINYFKNI